MKRIDKLMLSLVFGTVVGLWAVVLILGLKSKESKCTLRQFPCCQLPEYKGCKK